MLKITQAKFLTSVAEADKFLKSDKPVIAVCGKSNVGKSSFINMLANRNNLARVSKEPGRTRLVNYFDFGQFILADLPGYGYARVSMGEKQRWAKLLGDFFDNKQAAHVFALCDIRHPPTEDDRLMAEYLYFNIIPFTVIATKADKVSKAALGRSVQTVATVLKCGADDIIATSSKTRYGLDKVLERIEAVCSRVQTDS